MGIEFKAISMNDIVGSMRHLTMYQEIGYVNNSTKTVYIGTSSGSVYSINPSYLPTTPTNSLQIFVRHTQGMRQFRSDKEIVGNNFLVNYCDIPFKDIEANEHVYIKELDICVCLDPSKIEKYHKKIDKNIEKQIEGRVNAIITGINSAPIKVFGNDGYGAVDTLWLSIGNVVSSVKINRDPTLNTYCTLEIGSTNTKYFSYEIDLDKIRKGETVEIVTDEEVIGIGPTEDRIRNWQFQRRVDGGTLYTKTQINTLISESIRKYKNEIEDLKSDNSRISAELVRTKEELKHYRELYHSVISDNTKTQMEYLKQEQDKAKQEFEREKQRWEKEKYESDRRREEERQEWEREKRIYEREKLERDMRAFEEKNKKDTIDQVIKTMGIIVGGVVTVFTIYNKLQKD